jgi:DNA-binding MarR family transcriptional regulator
MLANTIWAAISLRNNSLDSESEITLGLLRAVQGDDRLTQRSAASDLGIALGLVNTYLKRCVKKGFIKILQVPRNRYAYYLTPQGFSEKSRLTSEYLSQSLSLFRQSQVQYCEILSQCANNKWNNVALYGKSDLSKIVAICAQEFPIRIVAIVQEGVFSEADAQLPVISTLPALGNTDAIIITDLNDPQQRFENAIELFPKNRVFAPAFLEIFHTPPTLEE